VNDKKEVKLSSLVCDFMIFVFYSFYFILVEFSDLDSIFCISALDIDGSGNPASVLGRGHPKLPIIDFLVTPCDSCVVELSEIGVASPPAGLQVHVALNAVPLISPNRSIIIRSFYCWKEWCFIMTWIHES